MIKAVHIHTNPKFVVDTARFHESYFINDVVIIGSSEEYGGPYAKPATFLSKTPQGLHAGAEMSKNADLVVLYGLEFLKAHLANRLPQDVTVAWRLFGYELYRERKQHYLSQKSRRFYMSNRSAWIGMVRSCLSQLKTKVEYGVTRKEAFAAAIDRSDLLLGLSPYEYSHLRQYWPSLPAFIQLPWRWHASLEIETYAKEKKVVIGNSRSVWNNHLDIVDIIDRADCTPDLSFLVPFSYGSHNSYSRAVEQRVAESLKRFRLLRDFLPRREYFDRITRASAAVFNSYRQMAMGNIFQLLGTGVKVYLNTRNVMYHWLTDLGFHVFPVDAFPADLESDNLELSTSQKLENTETIRRVAHIHSREKFAQEILDFIEARKRTS